MKKINKDMTFVQYRAKLLTDPSTRYVVKEIIKTLEDKDIIDAMDDIAVIKDYFEFKYKEMFESQASTDR